MGKIVRIAVLAVIGGVGLTVVAVGCWLPNVWLAFGGGIALCYVLARLVVLHPALRHCDKTAEFEEADSGISPIPETVQRKPINPCDREGLVEQMLAQGRYALLLRPTVAENLDEEQMRHAVEAMQEGMALVPGGEVLLGQADAADECDEDGPDDCPPGRLVRVEQFFLDRHPVTNRQYYEFVADGGYEQTHFWDESIWTAVLDFVDRTGAPGPRFWKDGCCLHGLEEHPVIGVSWYEAAAFARWVGKRLPSDAEWVKAGSWPVPVADRSTTLQRKHPWGDMMDRARVNLWGSGPGQTVPVDSFPDGVSVGGVYQMVGNIWEWTRSDFHANQYTPDALTLVVPMKSIRGGAFDTYFDNQANCHFQSGDSLLARKHNIGFRLAVGGCDLVFDGAASGAGEAAIGQ